MKECWWQLFQGPSLKPHEWVARSYGFNIGMKGFLWSAQLHSHEPPWLHRSLICQHEAWYLLHGWQYQVHKSNEHEWTQGTPLGHTRSDRGPLRQSTFKSNEHEQWLIFSVAGNAWCLQVLSLIHISEPTRRVVISYAVFCLKKKIQLIVVAVVFGSICSTCVV